MKILFIYLLIYLRSVAETCMICDDPFKVIATMDNYPIIYYPWRDAASFRYSNRAEIAFLMPEQNLFSGRLKELSVIV